MTIPKLYLGHFIYIPIGMLAILTKNEDGNVIALFLGIISCLAALAYISNIAIYYLTLRLSFGKKLLSSLMPTILAIVFFTQFKDLVGGFDIGPNRPEIWLLIINTIVNISTHILLEYRIKTTS